ncbi:MAG: F0F1 ATP synthase subunit delta [Clostridiales bacterium]|nr:F0F1 ATP synthase subunit delta [Clostridiales bacterium]
MEGLIITAFKLDDDAVDKIEKKFSKHINAEVKLKQEVDRALLGGFIVHIRNHMYDYSIKRRLEDMNKYLLSD